MQLFVYDDTDFVEYPEIMSPDFKSIDISKTGLNIHGLNDIPIIEAIGAFSE
jgi:hypothetical protein